jgi:hypothetical protein
MGNKTMDIKPALRLVVDSIENGYALPADLKDICLVALIKLEHVDELESELASLRKGLTDSLSKLTPQETARREGYWAQLGRDEFF